jgi:hypothetical protein
LRSPAAAQIPGTEANANAQAVADYGITAFPTTLLIDKNGVLVEQLHHGNVEVAKTQIERLLGK